MQVTIRADASASIGTGHVMRCLSLAEALRRSGATVEFLCGETEGNLGDAVIAEGHHLHFLKPEDSVSCCGTTASGVAQSGDADACLRALKGRRTDWLVVDHYGLDAVWQAHMRHAADRILVVDDLANRKHDCDLLLDQTVGRSEGDYRGKVSDSCEILLGTRFALLRQQFAHFRPDAVRKRSKPIHIKRVLVSLGGVDSGNVTSKVLDFLNAREWKRGYPEVDAILGRGAPHLAKVEDCIRKANIPVRLHAGTQEMALLMTEADFAIGAGGTTSWERCSLGLPAAVTVLAENQEFLSESLARSGAARIWRNLNELEAILQEIEQDPNALRDMAVAAFSLCDGIGSTRVSQEMQRRVEYSAG